MPTGVYERTFEMYNMRRGKQHYNYKKQFGQNTGRTRFKKGHKFWLGKKRPNMSRENNPNWNGGRKKDKDGYIMVLNPGHPFAKSNGYVYEHRLVMEKHIGRYLTRTEVVHHINKIICDNRIENLRLFENNGSHKKFHNLD